LKNFSGLRRDDEQKPNIVIPAKAGIALQQQSQSSTRSFARATAMTSFAVEKLLRPSPG
jgi:hypothetical protein